jgi:hypothetical protein
MLLSLNFAAFRRVSWFVRLVLVNSKTFTAEPHLARQIRPLVLSRPRSDSDCGTCSSGEKEVWYSVLFPSRKWTQVFKGTYTAVWILDVVLPERLACARWGDGHDRHGLAWSGHCSQGNRSNVHKRPSPRTPHGHLRQARLPITYLDLCGTERGGNEAYLRHTPTTLQRFHVKFFRQ